MNEPQDPDPNGLIAAMVGYHEMLASALHAGFTRREAFEMVRTIIQEHTRAASRGNQ